jgi:hypothetical protein
MFTWICPKCGSEVPPSHNECPNCRATVETAPVERGTTHFPPPPPLELPVKRPRRAPFSPLVAGLLAGASIVGVLVVLYAFILPSKRAPGATQPNVRMETPGNAAAPVHPLAKHLELTGVRVGDPVLGVSKIQMVVVNHSGADLPDLQMNVTLTANGKKIFDFIVPLASIGPHESKELSATVRTDMKPYELPDWSLVRADFRLASEP